MVNLWRNTSQATIRITNSIIIFFVVAFPIAVPLQTAAEDCTPPTSSSTGNNKPVGADSGLYTYNCGSGLWISPHYSFNPATGLYSSTDPLVYTYNKSTGNYDYTVWQFNAPTSNYIALTKSVTSAPSGATVIGGPTSNNTNSISNTGNGSNNTIADNGGVSNGSVINNTGPNSNNNISGNNTNNLASNSNSNTAVNNQLNANATTGNASVLSNTGAGNAVTGTANNVANEMNLLQSTSNALGGNAVTFVANIDGNVNGDLLINPSTLSSIQPAASNAPGTNNTTVNNSNNGTLTTNLNLNSASGNATVANNTNGGNANTGNANSIANVVNLIDSAISSGRSFLGVININGNLNGNITVPADFVNQLIAANVPTVNIVSNTGPSSNNSISSNNGNNNTVINNNNDQSVTNKITSNAKTGNANVNNNTSAGNAISGKANTDITAFNLTGSNLIGKNDLLVFVNVVGGKWVGLIVNAPAGSTAAEFGGGISTNSNKANNNTTVNNNNNQKIINNLNLNSKSGDANVTGNTKAGNATSGNANDAVNLLNIENSSLDLSNWFGVLFINVFGNWNGNFGNPVAQGPLAQGVSIPGSFNSAPTFRFVPSKNNYVNSNSNHIPSNTITNTGPDSNNSIGTNTYNSVLAASKDANKQQKGSTYTPGQVNWLLIIGGTSLFGLYIVGERYYKIRSNR